MLAFKREAVALVVLAFYFLVLHQKTKESRLQQLLLLQHLKRSRRKRLILLQTEEVVGAIERSRIPLKTVPVHERIEYFSRKLDYSIVVQAVADASVKFLD